MRIEDFNERLKHSILVADGAMGSLLYESVGPQRCVDELNSTHAEAVFHVHQTYIEAGAQLIETNTFSANRHKLSQFGMADRVAELNHRARENRARSPRSRQARSPDRRLHRSRSASFSTCANCRTTKFVAIFKEQAGALEERGVDLFILETFSDIEELLAAIDAIRSFSRLPIVAQLTYSDEGTTFGGTRPQDAWEKLKDKNIQAVGANCTIGPQLLLPVLRELAAAAKLPLSAMPNAGFPKRVGDRIVYPKSSPEYFALFAQEAAELGVRILGGCCGTTPEHIRAMAEAVKKLRPGKSARRAMTPPRLHGHDRSLRARRTFPPHRRARAGKQALAKNSGRKIRHLGRDRSAQGRHHRPHPRPGRPRDGLRRSGRD